MFTDCYLPTINGVVTSLSLCAAALRDLGHEVFVFSPQVHGYADQEKDSFRFAAFRFPFHKEEWVAIPFPRQTMKAVSTLDLDVYHLHTPFSVGWMGLSSARRRKRKTFFSYHTLFEEYVHYLPLPRRFSRWMARKWSQSFCNACGAVIVPCREIQEILLRYRVSSPIEVIPSPVDMETFRGGDWREGRSLLGLREGKPLLIYVGRLGWEKGLDFLLQAISLVLKGEDAVLAFIGDGPDAGAFKDLARSLGLAEKVLFPGYMKREKLKHLFAASSAFVFSSKTETQGIAVLEAMAGGVPVVALEAAGVREMITDGQEGYLVHEDLEAFAGRVLELLRSPQLKGEMGAKGMKKAEEFSPRGIAAALINLYSSNLESGHALC